MADRSRTWDGGYIREDAHGRDVYVIRQRVNGTRYEVSTRAFSVKAALEQLKRFQASPETYDPRGDERPDPIYLDKELSEEFLGYSRDEKQNTKAWVTEQRALLADWAEDLNGVDLRRASLRDDIEPALKRATSRQHRVAVLKALYSWLRTVKRVLTFEEDPTAGGALKVPQSDPSKRRIANKAVLRENVELVRQHLIGGYRDALDLQTATGWHVTEVQRFAAGGEIEPAAPSQREVGVAGILIVKHKSGVHHRTAVARDTLDVAQRLLGRGGLSISRYMEAVRSACKAAGLKKSFGPGQMRHSVATWAIESGVDLASMSTFLGHRTITTTKRFYLTHATPPNPLIVVPGFKPSKKHPRRRPVTPVRLTP